MVRALRVIKDFKGPDCFGCYVVYCFKIMSMRALTSAMLISLSSLTSPAALWLPLRIMSMRALTSAMFTSPSPFTSPGMLSGMALMLVKSFQISAFLYLETDAPGT